MHRPASLAAVGLLCLAGLAGCNKERGAKITGVLVEDGQPLRLMGKENVLLSMIPAQKDETSIKASPGAEFKREDSSFIFVGPGLGLVPPGEYKICLTVRPREGADRFDGQFSQENTPLTYTVTDEPKQELVIDVKKPSVTRK